MTKSPSLVLVAFAALLVVPLMPAKAATKSSKSPSKGAAPTKKAASVATKAKQDDPETPKAVAASPDESGKPAPAKSAAAAAIADKDQSPDKPKKKTEEDDKEGGPAAKKAKNPAAVSSMTVDELAGFENYPPALQEVVRQALDLTTQNLRYQFGSSDPKEGGMDCSGTMCRVLQSSGVKDVPRQSDEMCHWVMRHATLYRTEDTVSLKDPSMSSLHPGDLLFWTGTYDTGGQREIPISHVMMYLGKRKKDGKPIIFGASDGRSFEGARRNGVSVFDFSLPKHGSKAAFYGYGPIPGVPKEEVRPAIVRAVPAFAKQ